MDEILNLIESVSEGFPSYSNSVKINFIKIKKPFAYLHYASNMFTKVEKIRSETVGEAYPITQKAANNTKFKRP